MSGSAIQSELIRLVGQYGDGLNPETVVEEARDLSSPLHNSFEWDDTEAAQKYRVHQARMLLCTVVTYDPDSTGVPTRTIVSLMPDRKPGGSSYQLMATVMSDPEKRQQLLADALVEMERFQQKYRRLTELAEVFAAMDRAKVRVAKQKAKARRAATVLSAQP